MISKKELYENARENLIRKENKIAERYSEASSGGKGAGTKGYVLERLIETRRKIEWLNEELMKIYND